MLHNATLAGRAAGAELEITLVDPGFGDRLRIPSTVVLPLPLVPYTLGNRRVLIESRNQPLPDVVVEWMKGDRRYSGWFA